MTLPELSTLAAEASTAYAELVMLARAIDEARAHILNDMAPRLRAAARKYEGRQQKLAAQVDANRYLFVDPRSITLNGMICGLKKHRAGIAWPDSETLLASIHRTLPKQAETLIRTTEEPDKTALAKLDAEMLLAIGCHPKPATDEVIAEPVNGDALKLAAAILKQAPEEP